MSNLSQPQPVLLSPEHIAMIRRGVSCIVGSCDAALKPSIMRAVGGTVSEEGGLVTVFLARRQSRQLLQDIAASGRVSVVFGEPTTNRAVQLKGRGASTRAADGGDAELLQRYLASMEVEMTTIGYTRELARAMLAHQLGDVVAVSFQPEQAFDQTPGPKAGTELAAHGAPA